MAGIAHLSRSSVGSRTKVAPKHEVSDYVGGGPSDRWSGQVGESVRSAERERILAMIAMLSTSQRDDYEERAAIREFSGGQIRGLAERDALAEVLNKESYAE